MPNVSGEMTAEPDEATVTPPAKNDGEEKSQPGGLALLGRALLFSTEPYVVVRDGEHPGRRGFVLVLIIVAIVAVAQLIAYWLGWLTAPRLDSMQGLLYGTVTDWPWYAEQVQLDPAFATQFQQGYMAAWEALRILLGYPTLTATISVDVSLILTTLGNWFVFSVLAHWMARWFGSQARFGQTLGTVALAYAPLLLLVIQVVPGATVPLSLLFLLMLATKYMALKITHNLGTPQTLFLLAAPYVIAAIVAALVALYGGAYGLEQIPYFNDALKVQQFLAR